MTNPTKKIPGAYDANGNLVCELSKENVETDNNHKILFSKRGFFYGKQDKITEIIIPKNIIKIGRRVFSGCPNLTNIIIPDSVTMIADYAFCECNSLSSVTYKGITYINKWMLIKNLEENGVVIGCDAFHHTRLQS